MSATDPREPVLPFAAIGRRSRRPRSVAAALLLAACSAGACSTPAFVPDPSPLLRDPPADSVAAVLFLVGDGGDATVEGTPLLHRLREDVERWSAVPPVDSAVAVLYLGDNVYPNGLRARTHRAFPADSARLYAQAWVVGGPVARARGATAHFLAGNHDWGSRAGPEGVALLRNQDAFLRGLARTGLGVRLTPAAGTPGPVTIDLGGALRAILLDTHWWLQSRDAERRARLLADVEDRIGGAGGLPVVVAAHHPFESGGPHAGYRGFDPFALLRLAGATAQDMTSEPYRALTEGLARTFREVGRPLAFAGGHDHSLQVIRTVHPDGPEWSLVSGSASKLSGVGDAPGLTWAASRPGYLRLVALAGGRVELFAEVAPERFLACEGDAAERARCVRNGADAFATGYSVRLR